MSDLVTVTMSKLVRDTLLHLILNTDDEDNVYDFALTAKALRTAKPADDPFPVDWSKAPKWAQWHATNRNGERVWYESEPYPDSGYSAAVAGWRVGEGGERLGHDWVENYLYSLRRRPRGSVSHD